MAPLTLLSEQEGPLVTTNRPTGLAIGDYLPCLDASAPFVSRAADRPVRSENRAASGPARAGTRRRTDGAGLQYSYRARYYHPELSRFVSEDPLELGGGDVNLYAYVLNDPASNTDPTGEVLLAGCIAGAAMGVAEEVGSYVLAGRKTSLGAAVGNMLIGCATGAVGATALQTAGTVIGLAARSITRRVVAAGVRAEATSLAEQLALKEAQAGAGRRILAGAIRDPRFPGTVWAKMEHIHKPPVGLSITDKGVAAWSYGETIAIHYWEHLQTGIRIGFKFVSP